MTVMMKNGFSISWTERQLSSEVKLSARRVPAVGWLFENGSVSSNKMLQVLTTGDEDGNAEVTMTRGKPTGSFRYGS